MMTPEKKAYFDELGATGEWTTNQFLTAETAWQMKRIADRLDSMQYNGCHIRGQF
jgi:hypothetical protein